MNPWLLSRPGTQCSQEGTRPSYWGKNKPLFYFGTKVITDEMQNKTTGLHQDIESVCTHTKQQFTL